MEIKLHQGRPEDVSGRLGREIAVYDLLDSLGIEYTRADHEHVDTMAACEEIDAALGMEICKNLVLCNRQKTSFYLLLVQGDKPFHTREVSSQIGSARLSFGTPEDMERLLGLLPGSVSIMGLMNDREGKVRLLVDADVLKCGDFGCHPCVNTSTIRLKTADIFEKFLPAVGHDYTVVNL